MNNKFKVILISILVVIAVDGIVYITLQKKSTETVISNYVQENNASDNNLYFLKGADNCYIAIGDTKYGDCSNEQNYDGLEKVLLLENTGRIVYEGLIISTANNIYFGVQSRIEKEKINPEDGLYSVTTFYRLNKKDGELTLLISSDNKDIVKQNTTKYPWNAWLLGKVSDDERYVFFLLRSCEMCDEMISEGLVYDTQTKNFKIIREKIHFAYIFPGWKIKKEAFQFLENNSYRYLPDNSETYIVDSL